MNKGVGVLLALLVCMVGATLVMAQPAPFAVNGWVSDSSGDPVNGPNVSVTNTDTGEGFVVDTAAGSDYYKVVTCSGNVNAGHVLSFDVDGVTAATHPVTQDEMDDGGFEQNLTVGQTGVCGDVDGLPGITTNDGRHIFMYLLYNGAEPFSIDEDTLWAADCDGLCDGITTNDGRQIFMHLLHDDPAHPENDQYPLNCC
ncbi:MAG: hypothetical protein U9N36_07010 [Euryarchaeota archaeon]|nr:hypothetical protein [Euryarchaeota archaeon]